MIDLAIALSYMLITNMLFFICVVILTTWLLAAVSTQYKTTKAEHSWRCHFWTQGQGMCSSLVGGFIWTHPYSCSPTESFFSQYCVSYDSWCIGEVKWGCVFGSPVIYEVCWAISSYSVLSIHLHLETEYSVVAWLFGKVELSSPKAELRILEVFYHKIYKVCKCICKSAFFHF
jgi:hypothetical protein